jgi:hypothetical protein
MNIVRDDDDRWRFLKLVKYLNDENVPRNWDRDIGPDHIRQGFARPENWPQSKPYVSILAYCLMDNHFHFLLREEVDGGIKKFMHRLGTSMSKYFNEKYSEQGTLFEGRYRARVIDTDEYLQYLQAYIHVKNPLEKYPGGLARALREYDRAFTWAQRYVFAGLGRDSGRSSALLNSTLCDELLLGERDLRGFARDVLLGRQLPEDWEELVIDI